MSKITQTKLERKFGLRKFVPRQAVEVYNNKVKVITYQSIGQIINPAKFLKRHATKLKYATNVRNKKEEDEVKENV